MLRSLPSEKIWNTFVSQYNPSQSFFFNDREMIYQKLLETRNSHSSDELARSLVSAGDCFDFFNYQPSGQTQCVLELALQNPEKPLYKEITLFLSHHGLEIFFLKDFITRFWTLLSHNPDSASRLLENAFQYKNPQPWYLSFLDEEKKNFLYSNAESSFSRTVFSLFSVAPKYAIDHFATLNTKWKKFFENWDRHVSQNQEITDRFLSDSRACYNAALQDNAHWAWIQRVSNLLDPAIGDLDLFSRVFASISGLHVNGPSLETVITRPIHIACRSNNLDMVVWLVEKYGASVDVKDEYGWTPIDYAASHANKDLVAYLASKSDVIESACHVDAFYTYHRHLFNAVLNRSTHCHAPFSIHNHLLHKLKMYHNSNSASAGYILASAFRAIHLLMLNAFDMEMKGLSSKKYIQKISACIAHAGFRARTEEYGYRELSDEIQAFFHFSELLKTPAFVSDLSEEQKELLIKLFYSVERHFFPFLETQPVLTSFQKNYKDFKKNLYASMNFIRMSYFFDKKIDLSLKKMFNKALSLDVDAQAEKSTRTSEASFTLLSSQKQKARDIFHCMHYPMSYLDTSIDENLSLSESQKEHKKRFIQMDLAGNFVDPHVLAILIQENILCHIAKSDPLFKNRIDFFASRIMQPLYNIALQSDASKHLDVQWEYIIADDADDTIDCYDFPDETDRDAKTLAAEEDTLIEEDGFVTAMQTAFSILFSRPIGSSSADCKCATSQDRTSAPNSMGK